MEEITAGLLDKLKKLKGITDKELDDVFTFAIEKAVSDILDYCHIEELPARLSSTAIMMAIDVVNDAAITVSGAGEGEAKDIKEGDMSITRETKLDVLKAMSTLPSFARKYTRTLNSHRKLAR